MKKFLSGELGKVNMRPKNFPYVFLGFAFLAFFVGLSLLEEFGTFYSLDPAITQILQQIIPRWLDVFLSFFSLFGSIETTTLLLVIIGLFLFKKEKLIPYSLAVFALIMLIELLGKFHIYHPGPPKEFFRYALPFVTPHYISSTFSFPSGHMARTAFLALVVIVLLKKYTSDPKVRKILVLAITVIVIIMAVSRIYLGEHWASDVIGGLLLGTAFGFFAMVYY